MMRSGQHGFTLLETLLALVILATVFFALHQGLALGLQGVLATERSQLALQIARQRLAEAGVTAPLETGTRGGRSEGGMSWVMTSLPVMSDTEEELQGAAMPAFWLTVEVFWREWHGPARLHLRTVKLGSGDDAQR